MAEFQIRLANVNEVLMAPGGPVHKILDGMCYRAENAAKLYCPVDTGRLRASISHRIYRGARGLVGRIGTNVEYARQVHEGHGPIRPVRAKVLTWQPRSGPRVFAMSTRAVAGKPFLADGLRSVR